MGAHRLFSFAVLGFFVAGAPVVGAERPPLTSDEPRIEQQRSGVLGPEEGETLSQWTARWLDGPVQYIASEEEQKLYESLESTQERLQFIRLFWERRDPQIRGPVNEFLVEFEKRVAYANENFTEGDTPGWQTPFGQVALVLGPPDRTLRTSQGADQELSERPLWVWSYDKRISEWPVNENFIFVYRFRSWRLLPHTEPHVRNNAREAQRDWELTSTLDVVPTDFLRVQRALIQETTINPVNYRGAIEDVRATVAFSDADIPFGWEAEFATGEAGNTRIELSLDLRMETLIFHRDDQTYATQMLIGATLLTDDGEPVADVSEPIDIEIAADELEARGDEIVSRTIVLQAPAGSYRLQLVLEDARIGYRTVYRETLEVPSQ